MTNEQQELMLLSSIAQSINDLLDRQIERTKFFTLRIPANTFNDRGLPIGKGACRGVNLIPNINVLNSTATAAAQARMFYIGDSDGQFLQQTISLMPIILPCRDLSEIWVRNAIPLASGAVDTYAQIVVFLGRRDQIAINPDLLEF